MNIEECTPWLAGTLKRDGLLLLIVVLNISSVNDPDDCEGQPLEFRLNEVSQEIRLVVQEETSVE